MRKKVNSVFMTVVFAALTAFLAVEGADAFCVYNNTTDRFINVEQVSGGEFSAKHMDAGKKCCHWSNSDCNSKGKKDSEVKFNVYFGDYWQKSYLCKDFPIKAGGWLTVEKSGGDYRCVRHDY